MIYIDLNALIERSMIRYHMVKHEILWRTRDLFRPNWSYHRIQVQNILVSHHRTALFVLGLASGYWVIGPLIFG